MVKKLIIVSTKPDGGRGGGIPSALIGYMEGFDEQHISYEVVESHHENRNIIASWFSALIKIFFLSLKYRKSAVFWFHCGPWLSTLRKFTLALFPLICGSLTVAHIHSPTFFSYLSRNKLSLLLTKLSLQPYKKIIVLTPWWNDLLIKYGITKDIIISPNPCNKRLCNIAKLSLNASDHFSETTDDFQILTMARLIPGKGVEHVIRAMSHLPIRFRLIIAGEGQLRTEMEKLVSDLGLKNRVRFLGWVNGEEKERLLNESDLFCLPSTYDSFGMVFIEAMAFNLPVVAYGWGPIQDVVTPDVGICCQEATPEVVARTIMDVAKNISLYSSMGARRVLDSYTPQIAANNFIKLLRVHRQ